MRSLHRAVTGRSSAGASRPEPPDEPFSGSTIEVAEDLDFRASQRRSYSRRAQQERVRQRTRSRRLAIWGCAGIALIGSGAAVAKTTSSRDGGGSTVQVFRVGSSGDVVKALQRKVGTTADGAYGPKTRAAVRRFQRRNDLSVDGIAGPQTLGAAGISSKLLKAATASASPSGTAPNATLQKIAQCESGGDPTAIGGGGQFRGKYQFTRATWAAVGGAGDPAAASEAEQDKRAAILLAQQGTAPWPVCGN